MKSVLLAATLTLATLGLSFSPADAQKGKGGSKRKVVSVTGTAAETGRGMNSNIKTDRPTADVQMEKGRGSSCSVYFNNYTGLYIDVYMDGNYQGTISPYGGSTYSVYGGYTTIYCRSTGGTREWTAAGSCTTSYEYQLR